MSRIFYKLVIQFALVFFVLLCLVQVTTAGIYSYRDDKGVVHFTDEIFNIPGKYRENKQGPRNDYENKNIYRVIPSPSSARAFPRSVSSSEEIQVPLIPAGGGNFLVDTVLNGHINARLMLDTGASLITLTEEIGRKLGVSAFPDSAELPFNTAAGEDWMPLVGLEIVAVGSAKTRLIEASINSHIKKIDGLLGMSFLGEFRFEIDRINKRLTLKPLQNLNELEWDDKPGDWWKSRFEHYDKNIKNYSSRANSLLRNGHKKALNLKNTVELYKDLLHKLETRASISGLPPSFRPQLKIFHHGRL